MTATLSNALFGLGHNFSAEQNRKDAWEARFSRWRSPPSDTEAEKIERTERMIREAVAANEYLSTLNLEIFAQGSYSNNTNVKGESDVDICVLMHNTYYYETIPAYPGAVHAHEIAHFPIVHTPATLKANLYRALVEKFGAEQVSLENKCIKIRSSTVRVDADVVPATVHRRYTPSAGESVSLSTAKIDGIAIHSNQNGMIASWPQQHNQNGRVKNNLTGRRFKAVVRILKSLNLELEGPNYIPLRSFLIECLVYNCPNHCFESEKLYDNVQAVLTHISFLQGLLGNPDSWLEIHEMKKLFGADQPWRIIDVLNFVTHVQARLAQNP